MYHPNRAVPIAFAALVAFSCCFAAVLGEDKLNVDVYYETLCPDSMYFITKQLTPAFNGGLKDHLNVNLVPFGKASWTEEGNNVHSSCQHGPMECHGNKIHACAIYEIENTVKPEDQQQRMIDFVGCAMTSFDPEAALKQCAQTQGFNDEFVKNVENCSNSKQGDDLFMKHGQKTKGFQSPLEFVPSIVINGEKSSEAFRNFTGVVCSQIPGGNQVPICKQ
ncbi:GILT-like protein 1 [Copidosoma floridanum]|uniref:GILT-like protein 1 n=1 Tax=Copidosoma floridanum TaxID=29053 RepID=UPI0006C986DF|nr:GILT-like protein 1 [Copidosoma floridanum]